jgi:DNA polymerase-3 subunit beta
MKIEQYELSKPLSDVGLFVASKPTIPVLSHVKLECDHNVFTLKTSDLEAFCIRRAKCLSKEVWETTVPFTLFNDLVSGLSGQIELVYSDTELGIICGNIETGLKTVDATEFPVVPEQPDVKPLEFESKELIAQLASVVSMAATDENRPILTGVYLNSDGQKMVAVTADGFRMAVYTTIHQGDKFSMVIPAKFISSLLKIISKSECKTVTVYHTTNQAIFELDENTVLISQLIEGRFPDWTQIMPKTKQVTAVVDKKEFLHQVKLLGIIASKSNNILTLEFQDDKIKLSANTTDVGDGDSDVNAKVDGEQFESAINHKFLTQTLNTMTGKIVIEQGGKARPIKIYPENNENNCHVIMPMHIKSDS